MAVPEIASVPKESPEPTDRKSEKDLNYDPRDPFVPDENVTGLDALEYDETLHTKYTDEQYRKLLWKIDLWLIPLMYVIYGLQQLDKTSISSQYLFGIAADTGMHGQQYAWLTTIFYITYMVFEFPSNWILQRYKIGRSLTFYIFGWGSIVMLTSVCTKWAHLMTLRAIQGILECTIGPGFLFIVSSWYTQREHAARALIFMSANSGMGIIADVAIYFMGTAARKHPEGLPAWKAIGIFIGGWTVLVSVIAFFILGTPQEVWWLSHEEKVMARARILKNNAGTDVTGKKVLKIDQIKEAFTDPMAWFATVNSFLISIPNGSVSTFGTVINKAFGFTQEQVMLYGIPRSAFASLWFYFMAFVTSRIPNMRMILMLVALIPGFAGFLAISFIPNSYDRRWEKWGIYFITTIVFTPLFMGWSLIASNTAGKTKKSAVTSMVFVGYCVGNMVGSQIFRSNDAPQYHKATTVISVVIAVNFLVILAWRFWVIRVNRLRDAAQAQSGQDTDAAELEGKDLGLQDVTDRQNKHFRYSY